MANLIFPAYSTIATEAVAYALTSLDNDLELSARSTTITVAGEEAGEAAPQYSVTLSAPAGMMCHITLAFDTPAGGVAPAGCQVKFKGEDGTDATPIAFTDANDEVTLLSLGDKKFLQVEVGALGIDPRNDVIGGA